MINIDKMLNQEVSLRGVAKDAHASAVLLTDDNQVIYIDGVAYWKSNIIDKPIQVKGVLRRRKLGPDPSKNSKGLVSHGIEGTQYVLEDSTWNVITK